jgi:hypothetical protein
MAQLSQRARLVVLALYAAMFAVLCRVALGSWLPSATPEGLWFYSGVAALLLGGFLTSPFFTKPADALPHAVAAAFAVVPVAVPPDPPLSGAHIVIPDWTHWSRRNSRSHTSRGSHSEQQEPTRRQGSPLETAIAAWLLLSLVGKWLPGPAGSSSAGVNWLTPYPEDIFAFPAARSHFRPVGKLSSNSPRTSLRGQHRLDARCPADDRAG